MILLDTDHFSVVTDGRHQAHAQLAVRLQSCGETLTLPVVSVEEQLRGWLAQIRRQTDVSRQIYPYDRLMRLLDILGDWEIARWGQPAAEQFQGLRKRRVRIGTQDLKIAAIAMVHDALLLSANLRDFEQVPGLRVEDWIYSRST